MKDINKYRGCLIGGAVGDALGYPVEFLTDEQIFGKYGEDGITNYDLIDGVAQISDDTQMTLFTANGLLFGTTREMTRDIIDRYPSYIASCYREWLKTQNTKYYDSKEFTTSWLMNIPELYRMRAPGNTCLCAIAQDILGTIAKPITQSKDCGGIMRVAPIGLYFDGKKFPQDGIDRMGAEAVALTHGHELGYIPAAAFVHIVSLLAHNEDISVLSAVKDSISAMERLFPEAIHMGELLMLIRKAITLAESDLDDLDAIRELGCGWVAEETLTIAVYSALKYADDFDKAIIASVSHSGDTDSTGAATGNILGAHLGYDAIPERFIENLELREIIVELADDLYNDCQFSESTENTEEPWVQKYIYKSYMGRA